MDEKIKYLEEIVLIGITFENIERMVQDQSSRKGDNYGVFWM